MYEKYFLFSEKPFNLTPNPKYMFYTKQHLDAFNMLLYGIKEKKGFIEISGEIGSGKTTLIRTLLNQVEPENTEIAIILNPNLTEIEFLRNILDEFGIPVDTNDHLVLVDLLNNYLVEQSMNGRNVVVIIDEAHTLNAKTLEEIRLLTNFETETQKLIQIILVGQKELHDILNDETLKQLKQRIALRYHISNLTFKQMCGYIRHRLDIASEKKTNVKISLAAYYLIYKFSKGNPRLVNIVMDRSLMVGWLNKTNRINFTVSFKAIHDIMGLDFKRFIFKRFVKLSITLIVIGIIIISIFKYDILNFDNVSEKNTLKIVKSIEPKKDTLVKSIKKKKEIQKVEIKKTSVSQSGKTFINDIYRYNMKHKSVGKLQNFLKLKGLYTGKIDDELGFETRKGLINYLLDMDIKKIDKNAIMKEHRNHMFSKGDLGIPVKLLQYHLKKLGYFKYYTTGFFGDRTLRAVKRYQRRNNKVVTGIMSFTDL